MLAVSNLGKVRQVVVIGVRVIHKAAFGDDEFSGMNARPVTAVPAQRTLAARLLNRLDSPLHVLLLFFPAQSPVLTPAPAVRARLVATLGDPFAHFRIPFQGDRTGKKRHLNFIFVKETHEPPDSGPASVFVDGLGREIPIFLIKGIVDLGQPFVALVAGRFCILGALFIIHHQIHGHLGIMRPDRLRRPSAIADKVTLRTGHLFIDQLHGPPPYTILAGLGCSCPRMGWG